MNDPSKRFSVSQSRSSIPDALPVAKLETAVSESVVRSSQTVAIIGGGLAGMAAAAIACKHGLPVDLFEQSGHLGGRAGSIQEQ